MPKNEFLLSDLAWMPRRTFRFSIFFLSLLNPHLLLAATCCADSNSTITTFAGTGAAAYTGDGGPASSATFNFPYSVVLDPLGDIYVADDGNHVIRMINPAGLISTVAGSGTSGYSGDGGPATSAELIAPAFLALDSGGNLYISDFGAYVIRKVSPGGTISTVAGDGSSGYSGDGGPATSANLNPYAIGVDQFNHLFLSDISDHVIRMVDNSGTISTIAGTGVAGYSGDGGPATAAKLTAPEGIAFDSGSASIYFWDDGNFYVRKIDSCGIISSVAGNGVRAESGDGGPALSASLEDAEGLAFCNGNLYLSDWASNTVRMINSCNVISLLGGQAGTRSDAGDGGLFSAADLFNPEGIAFDSSGNLYIAEFGGNRIRKVSKDCAASPTPACVLIPTATPACTQAMNNNSPTISPSFSSSPSITISPTATNTPTPSACPTSTPSFSNTPTASPCSTTSPTRTISSTFSPSPSITQTFSSSPTPDPTPLPLLLHPYPPNPDPAGPSGVFLPYWLQEAATINIKIYDVSGETVRTLDPYAGLAGVNEQFWDERNSSGLQVASGIYIMHISAVSQRGEQQGAFEKCAVLR